jgi:integrase/recombinase XerD
MMLMEESEISAKKPVSMAAAVRFRDGLMIALLAQVPLRHKNFADLEIDRDLIKEDDYWSIIIPPAETKTRTYLEFELPDSICDQFSTYLKLVRPRMLRRSGCKSLWVSPKGGALSYSALGPVFTRHTMQKTWRANHATRCP